MTKEIQATLVDKHAIKDCKFPNEKIQLSTTEVSNLLIKLKVATILGNMEKIKCRIFFRDSEELKVVETTIWATCEKNIVLKAGIFIPIRRIVDVLI